jgi:hypothetical protein
MPLMSVRSVLAALALPAGLFFCATPAGADSLVYVKNGTVYVSQPDGSQGRAITTGNNDWAWPSETDNGIIAVAGGLSRVVNGTFNPSGSDQIYEFNQQGHQLSGPANTQGSFSTVGDPEYVSHFRVAPDNSNIAYTVLPSYADAYTSWQAPGGSNFSEAKGSDGSLYPYSSPEWWGTQHILFTHDGPVLFNEAQYGMYSLADGSAPGWNQDDAIGSSPGYQVTVARDGLKYAVEADDAADYTDGTIRNISISIETTATSPSNPSSINLACRIPLPASQFSTLTGAAEISMSFSSDGNTLAWGQDDGIYEANVSNPSDCSAVTSSVHKVVDGGAMPFLGAAPLSACGTCNNGNSGGSGATPNTRLEGAKISKSKHAATFTFGGSNATSFKCKLDRGKWASCRSPKTYKHLKRGGHTFAVYAISSGGKADPSPATKKFRI